MLSRKIRPPGLPRDAASRPHLDSLFEALLSSHEAIGVLAAAGSGKTVQTQKYLERVGQPFAWLTLDRFDRSGSRLLTYLAEAVSVLSPEVGEHTRAALDQGLSLFEVAASLAGSIPDERALVVLDDCEAIASSSEAGEVLTAFLDYLRPRVQAILLSREDFAVPITRMMVQGRLGRVSGADLALDLAEARRIFDGAAAADVDLAALVEATRGWIAAVAFNMRSDLGPAQGPDALARFLYDEVLSGLDSEERVFLLRTSLLTTVSARGAEEIYGPGGHELWLSICSRHLPVTLTTDRELVYHPRFREFLLEQLQLQHPAEVPALQHRHARHLARSGSHEDAVEAFLEAGDIESAVTEAELAVTTVCQRADWGLLERWFAALGPDAVTASPFLTAARLKSLVGRRGLAAAQELIRLLATNGRLEGVTTADPSVTAYIGWSLQWSPAEALTLMKGVIGDFRSEAVRFELEAISGRDPVDAPDRDEWSDVERLLSWGLLVQGRLDPLIELLPCDVDWPPRSFFRTPHPLLGLVWRGSITRARELFDEVPETTKAGAHTDLWFFHEAWLCWAEGDLPAALRAAEAAVDHSRKTGFGWEPCFHSVVGCMLIANDRVDDAEVVLAESIARSGAAGALAYVEWAQTFLGLAHLRSGRARDAARVLRLAVAQMVRARRTLMVPIAATYLSEAEHQLGNIAGSRNAAATALHAATEMDASFVLRRALNDVPSVLHRQMDGPDGDVWRRMTEFRPVAPHIRVEEPGSAPTSRMHVQTFGPNADIVLDGARLSVRRIKVLELVGMLALSPEGVGRQRLQFGLFPDADQRRGGNYFRQVVHKLRQLTGITLARREDGVVAVPSSVRLSSSDDEFEHLLESARDLVGVERLETLSHAVELARLPYLPASDLEWVCARREHLTNRLAEASFEAAELALELGQVDRARSLAELAISIDECAEPAYRTLMTAALLKGDLDEARARYDQLADALGGLGLVPTLVTERLLGSMHHLPA